MTTLTAGPQEAQRETRYMPEASSIASGPANPARETLTLRGPEYVSNPELIAMVTRGRIDPESVSGSAWLLERFEGVWGLGNATYAELKDEARTSDAETCRIMAAIELGRRFAAAGRPSHRISIETAQDAANLLEPEMCLLEQEHLRVLLLDTKNQVLGIREIYAGNVKSTVVRPAEVLRPAVRANATSLIVAHNHPSGNPAPSPDDVAITKDLAQAGELLGIKLMDHIVLGNPGRYVSMKRERLGFS